MKRKILAVAMAVAMIVSSIVVTCPIDVSAAAYPNTTELTYTGWWQNHTGGYLVDETGVQITFDFKTLDSATANWNAPLAVLYSSDDGTVTGDNYKEYQVMRSDMYAWIGDYNSGLGYNDWYAQGFRKYELFNPDWWVEDSYKGTNDFTWANWLADNKEGNAPGSVIAVREGNYVEVRMDINGVPTVWKVPVPAGKDVYVGLTCDVCDISNISARAFGGDYSYGAGWWTSKSQGYKVDPEDGLKLTFTSTSDSNASANNHTSGLVVFTGSNNYVNGADYYEYGFIRGDVYGWGVNNTEFNLVRTAEADWNNYLETHKAGTTCEVEANIVDGKLVVVYKNVGGISTTTIGVDTTKDVYIAVSGHYATASNIKVNDDSEEIMEVLGAQVKQTDTTYSIGFVSTIDKTTFDTIKDDIVEMGVLMKNDVKATSLALLKGNVGEFVKKVTTRYVTDLSVLDSTQSDSSVYAFRSIVTGVSLLYKDFTAVPYVTYMDGEEEVTVYGDALSRCIHDCVIVNE